MIENNAKNNKNENPKVIFITAGGTGGHVFPALSIYKELQERGHIVYFFTDERGNEFIKNEQIPLKYKFNLGQRSKLWKFLPRLFYYYLKSRSAVSSFKPDLSIGFGGYPSFPIMLAASHKNIPTIIHEQNAILGKANALLAYNFISSGVGIIATSWPITEGLEKQSVEVQTGLPLRPEILSLAQLDYKPNKNSFKILVLGGSLGAAALDNIVLNAIKEIPPSDRKKIELIIQSNSSELHTHYKKLGIPAKIQSFFDNLEEILIDIDIVICRAGASTLSELQLASKPLIAIPLPNSADNHQLKNAQIIEKNKSGIIVEQNMRSSKTLSSKLTYYIKNQKELVELSKESRAIAVKSAHENLSNLIEEAISINEERLAATKSFQGESK